MQYSNLYFVQALKVMKTMINQWMSFQYKHLLL